MYYYDDMDLIGDEYNNETISHIIRFELKS